MDNVQNYGPVHWNKAVTKRIKNHEVTSIGDRKQPKNKLMPETCARMSPFIPFIHARERSLLLP
jgi:hypothetical protein